MLSHMIKAGATTSESGYVEILKHFRTYLVRQRNIHSLMRDLISIFGPLAHPEAPIMIISTKSRLVPLYETFQIDFEVTPDIVRRVSQMLCGRG